MSADMLVPALILAAGFWWATRGRTDGLSTWIRLHEDNRTPLPRVSAARRRSPQPWPVQPHAIEAVDAELLPDPEPVARPALPQYPEIVVEAYDVEPVPGPVRRELLAGRRAIQSARRSIEPRRDSDRDAGVVTVHAVMVAVAGLAVVLVVAARLVGLA